MNNALQCIRVRPYDEVVDAYGLAILQAAGDWTLEVGGLAETKDGDFKVGDDAYNSLFRLVQSWRHSLPHLRHLFDQMRIMLDLRHALNSEMNRLGETRHQQMAQGYTGHSPDYSEALRDVWERQDAATIGANIYAGSLVMMLSGMLLRFKDDLIGKGAWPSLDPIFNGHCVGAVIEASANGFRHADEWAKTHKATAQQKRSQDVIIEALGELWVPGECSPGRCVQVIQMLSGGVFESLAANVLTSAHNISASVRGSEARGD